MPLTRRLYIACVVCILGVNSAAASDAVTLSVMPAFNHGRGFDRRLDPLVRLFRERMVSVLVEQYDCVVLSRSYGLELAREEVLASLSLSEKVFSARRVQCSVFRVQYFCEKYCLTNCVATC